MNDEDFDDDDDFGPLVPYRIVESKPITKYTFINFAFSFVSGCIRSLAEATSDLADAFIGAEGYDRNQKQFEDEARVAIESIAEGSAED